MKIDSTHVSLDSAALQRLDKAAEPVQTTRAPKARATADRVDLSADAALAGVAAKAASDAPDIRQDLVARMRTALASGELGADAGKLADRLIDRLTDPKA